MARLAGDRESWSSASHPGLLVKVIFQSCWAAVTDVAFPVTIETSSPFSGAGPRSAGTGASGL